MKLFSILIVCLLFSCQDGNKQMTDEVSEIADTLNNKKIKLDSAIYNAQTNNLDSEGKERFEDTLLFGKKWSDIEMSGDPDTALALFTYRIIFTDNKEEADDCVSLMNVLEGEKVIKKLIKSIFSYKTSVYNFDKSIDSLNKASVLHAKEIVEQEIQDYGSSEGPCYELYEFSK